MQISRKLSWEDYRYVLAIYRAGGITSAVGELGVNSSTAFRRLDKIERSIQTLLFDRARKGYLPTAAGQEVVQAAEIMEQAAFRADRVITGHDQQLTGQVRVTATETLATCFLSRHVESFRNKYPGLSVTIISENRVLSLTERESDIALRPRKPSDQTLIGRKVGTLKWGVYGSTGFQNKLGKVSVPADPANHPFIVWTGGQLAMETESWIKQSIPNVDIAFRSNSMLTIAQMASTGVGLAVLPCLVGAVWPGLVPIKSPLNDERTAGELWSVYHEDMRHNARVRAMVEHLAVAAQQDIQLFEGRQQLNNTD